MANIRGLYTNDILLDTKKGGIPLYSKLYPNHAVADRRLTGTGTVDADTAKAYFGGVYTAKDNKAETRSDREAVRRYVYDGMLFDSKTYGLNPDTATAVKAKAKHVLSIIVPTSFYERHVGEGIQRTTINGKGERIPFRASARYDRGPSNAVVRHMCDVLDRRSPAHLYDLPEHDLPVQEVMRWFAENLPNGRVVKNQNGLSVRFTDTDGVTAVLTGKIDR